jgi:hypothetical protein
MVGNRSKTHGYKHLHNEDNCRKRFLALTAGILKIVTSMIKLKWGKQLTKTQE